MRCFQRNANRHKDEGGCCGQAVRSGRHRFHRQVDEMTELCHCVALFVLLRRASL